MSNKYITWMVDRAEARVLADTNSSIFSSVSGISHTDIGIRTTLVQLSGVKKRKKSTTAQPIMCQ